MCCPALLAACGNHSGEAEHLSGIGLKLFGFIAELVFAFIPESCSRSSRNAVRNHPGIAFTLPRIPQCWTDIAKSTTLGAGGEPHLLDELSLEFWATGSQAKSMSGFRGQRFSQQAALKVSCRLSISAEERRATADAFFGSSAEINSSSAQIWLQMAFDALCDPYPDLSVPLRRETYAGE